MYEPLREGWFKYYIAEPLRDVWYWIKETTSVLRIKLIGGWYCEYCHKIHGRRVYRYKLIFVRNPDNKQYVTVRVNDAPCLTVDHNDRLVCSLGKKATIEEGWTPAHVSLYEYTQATLNTAISELAKVLGKNN